MLFLQYEVIPSATEKDLNSEPIIGTFCHNKTGLITLVESLNQLKFKGFTTQQWCEEAPHVINCAESKFCGECMGQCPNPNDICYLSNINVGSTGQNKFICWS